MGSYSLSVARSKDIATVINFEAEIDPMIKGSLQSWRIFLSNSDFLKSIESFL